MELVFQEEPDEPVPHLYSQLGSALFGIVFTSLIIAGLLNILILTAIIKNKIWQRSAHVFIFNLSAIDMIIVIDNLMTLSMIANNSKMSPELDLALAWIHVFGLSISIWTLAVLAIMRFKAVMSTVTLSRVNSSDMKRNRNYAIAIVAIIWLLCVALFVPIFVPVPKPPPKPLWNRTFFARPYSFIIRDVENPYCHRWKKWTKRAILDIIRLVIVYFVPLVISTIAYTGVITRLCIIRIHSNRDSISSEVSSSSRSHAKTQSATRAIIALVVLFIACTLPSYSALTYCTIARIHDRKSIPDIDSDLLKQFLENLTGLYPLLSPFFLLWLSSEYKKHVIEIFQAPLDAYRSFSQNTASTVTETTGEV